jgi:hypothetical protein
MNRRALSLWGLSLIWLALGGGRAEAQQKAAILSTDWLPLPKKEADKLPPRQPLRVKVRANGVSLKKDDFKISIKEEGKPITIPASKMEAFNDSREEMAVFVLVQGTVRWMGDPHPEPAEGETEAPSEIPGYYDVVKPAIDNIAKVRARNSKAALYVYTDRVEPKIPMGDISGLGGEGLGPQSDYAKVKTKVLKTGLQVANTELTQTGQGVRRVLIVIGDANDQTESYSVKEEANRLLDSSIEVYAICISPTVATPINQKNCKKLGELGAHWIVEQKDGFATAVDEMVKAIAHVYTLEFPGLTEDGIEFPYDGDEHAIQVAAKQETTDEKAIIFPKRKADAVADEKPTSLLWLWILLGVVGLIAVLIVAVVLFKKGSDDEIDEEPVAQAPAPPAVALAPAAPAKPAGTMMLNIGGEGDSMPVVGWIVPLTGPNAWQTFKLSQKTLIGRGAECQVAISDPFMSSKHAEIVMNPGGFVLMDAGSSSGMMVNSKKVSQHELVDNDTFTLGKTEFKYKSIN